jgi:hypothetical protein
MTRFQLTSASLAILLDVFSDMTDADIAPLPSTDEKRQKLRRMQERVASGEFWDRLGGLSDIERQLRSGFREAFPVLYNNETGNQEEVLFPKEVESLLSGLRHCGGGIAALEASARAALPHLRAFVEGRCAS